MTLTKPLWAFALLIVTLCTSSCGTFGSRWTGNQSARDGYFFGWPLFASLPIDIDLVVESGSCKTFGVERVFGVVSMPIDLVLDLVLLPVDVLSGSFGHQKNPHR